MYCEQHSGLYVTNHRGEEAVQLLKGLPHAVLLRNAAKELFILCSAAVKPTRPREVQSEDVFAGEMLLVRSDAAWVKGLGKVRHYLFPVHVSKMFLVMPSLAASLHLLVLRFLQRQYPAVASLVTACVSDTALTSEEQQVGPRLSAALCVHLSTAQADASDPSHAS